MPVAGRSFYFRSIGAFQAFTLVEVLISLVIMAALFLVSTATLNLFDTRAAKNRNTEAARAIVDDYVNYLLADSTNAPTATSNGTDLDGDGIPDGVPCTLIDSRAVPATIPVIVTRTASPSAVVSGSLYWRVQAVGTAYGLKANTDLMQVNFMLAYTYRNQTYYYKAVTFKAST